MWLKVLEHMTCMYEALGLIPGTVWLPNYKFRPGGFQALFLVNILVAPSTAFSGLVFQYY